VSTANFVPETHDLGGDDAYVTLRRAKVRLLCKDSFQRFRFADGFSHSRAMAFQIVLTMIPGSIVLIALAVALESATLKTAVNHTAASLTPRPTAELFREALTKGADNGASSHWAALVFGGIAMLVAGATAFGQIERTANRLYGVEADRPALQKYGRAALLALTAGTLAVVYLLVIGSGSGWVNALHDSVWGTMWSVVLWPIGAALLVATFSIIFKVSPRRRQPRFAWLAVGGALAVAMTLVVSLLLHAYMNTSRSFGDTYGPLAGFVGVLLWAYLSSVALFLGLSFAAQLEAFRAGQAAPRSEEKVEQSEPDAPEAPDAPKVPVGAG